MSRQGKHTAGSHTLDLGETRSCRHGATGWTSLCYSWGLARQCRDLRAEFCSHWADPGSAPPRPPPHQTCGSWEDPPPTARGRVPRDGAAIPPLGADTLPAPRWRRLRRRGPPPRLPRRPPPQLPRAGRHPRLPRHRHAAAARGRAAPRRHGRDDRRAPPHRLRARGLARALTAALGTPSGAGSAGGQPWAGSSEGRSRLRASGCTTNSGFLCIGIFVFKKRKTRNIDPGFLHIGKIRSNGKSKSRCP